MAGVSAASTGVSASAAAAAPSRWRRARLSGSAGRSSRWIRRTASVAAAARPGAGRAAAARTARAVASGAGSRPGDAVGGRLGVVNQRGAQVRVRAPDQAGGLRVPHRLPPDRAQVGGRGKRGAGQHRGGQGEAELAFSSAARRGVGGAQPQHARADQLAQLAAQGGRMDRQGQPGQPQGGVLRLTRSSLVPDDGHVSAG